MTIVCHRMGEGRQVSPCLGETVHFSTAALSFSPSLWSGGMTNTPTVLNAGVGGRNPCHTEQTQIASACVCVFAHCFQPYPFPAIWYVTKFPREKNNKKATCNSPELAMQNYMSTRDIGRVLIGRVEIMLCCKPCLFHSKKGEYGMKILA